MVIMGAALLRPKVFHIVTQMQTFVKIKTAKGTKKLETENQVT